jgi:hypothetical protein
MVSQKELRLFCLVSKPNLTVLCSVRSVLPTAFQKHRKLRKRSAPQDVTVNSEAVLEIVPRSLEEFNLYSGVTIAVTIKFTDEIV